MGSDHRAGIQLARIGEIAFEVLKQNPSNSFFQNFQSQLNEIPGKRTALEFYEAKFASLSESDWNILRSKVIPQFLYRDSNRAWQSPFNIFNEAIAYCFLLMRGCENVAFIPEGRSKTPDISTSKRGQKIACEVKTINVSDEKVRIDQINQRRWARGKPGLVCSISDQLPEKFVETKLLKTINQNLDKFKTCPDALKVFLFVLNFDERSHEYADRYFLQIKRKLEQAELPIDALFCIDNSTMWRSEPLVLEWPNDAWKRLGG